MIGLEHFLVVSLLVFLLGLYCVLTRRNAIGILMGVELILNSANINYLAFARYGSGEYDGQVFAIFVIMLAAAEALEFEKAARLRDQIQELKDMPGMDGEVDRPRGAVSGVVKKRQKKGRWQ